MSKEPHLTGFWRALGYRGELVVIDRAFLWHHAKLGVKGFFFPLIAGWYLVTGKRQKAGELFRELTRVP